MDGPPDQGLQSANRRALVVDDDPILREVMCAQLLQLGLDCETAENGEEGRKKLCCGSFDLAVVDISMPLLDGFALLRHIRQHPRSVDLPVIVCTSHNDQASIDKAYTLGASSFVTKPINWPQFAYHALFVMRSGESERALRLAKTEALAASRMKNGLFHVLSHELKTPLSALIGLSDVLHGSLGGRATAEERDQLQLLMDGAQRLNGIISDVLILSKALSGAERKNFTSTPVQELLDDCLVGHRAAGRDRDVQIVVRPMDGSFSISCDPHLMRQALSRLISNAIKFSPPGGKVEVWAHLLPDGSPILSVRDQGQGLSQSRLQECLKPFVQDDMSYSRPAEGLGLGLPIAKAICEAHGGELVIQTALGQGLLAAIALPAALVSDHSAAA